MLSYNNYNNFTRYTTTLRSNNQEGDNKLFTILIKITKMNTSKVHNNQSLHSGVW